MPVARGWREVVFAICCGVKMSELRAVWTASDRRQEDFLKQILHSTQSTSLGHFHFLLFFSCCIACHRVSGGTPASDSKVYW